MSNCKFLPSGLTLLVLSLCFSVTVCSQQVQSQKDSHTPLEVRLDEPLRWENGCLVASLIRTNYFAGPLFLTKMGPYFDIALDVSKDDSQRGPEVEWVNIFGSTDLRDMTSDSVASGATVHNSFCFPPTVSVTNYLKHTRREIPVRGKLRIRVSYSLSEEDSKRYQRYGEEGPLGRALLWATILAEIPCPINLCAADCDKPPIGIHGEVRGVPDVGQSIPDVNSRGKKLADELLQKFPPCTAEKSISNKVVQNQFR